MPRVTLRPASRADAAFAYRVEEDAMRAYAEQTWGQWNPAKDSQAWVAAFNPEAHEVIEVDGLPAGVLAHEQRAGQRFLAKLYLMAAYRGCGVGGEVLGRLLAQATQRGENVALNVLAVNTRARAFYERNGFAVTRMADDRVEMVYSVAGARRAGA